MYCYCYWNSYGVNDCEGYCYVERTRMSFLEELINPRDFYFYGDYLFIVLHDYSYSIFFVDYYFIDCYWFWLIFTILTIELMFYDEVLLLLWIGCFFYYVDFYDWDFYDCLISLSYWVFSYVVTYFFDPIILFIYYFSEAIFPLLELLNWLVFNNIDLFNLDILWLATL